MRQVGGGGPLIAPYGFWRFLWIPSGSLGDPKSKLKVWTVMHSLSLLKVALLLYTLKVLELTDSCQLVVEFPRYELRLPVRHIVP